MRDDTIPISHFSGDGGRLQICLPQYHANKALNFSLCYGIAASIDVTLHIPCFVRGGQRQPTLLLLQIILYGFLPSSFIFPEFLHLHRAQAMNSCSRKS